LFQSEAASVKIKNKNLNVNISAVEGKGRRSKRNLFEVPLTSAGG
jgi:hypothetical protein